MEDKQEQIRINIFDLLLNEFLSDLINNYEEYETEIVDFMEYKDKTNKKEIMKEIEEIFKEEEKIELYKKKDINFFESKYFIFKELKIQGLKKKIKKNKSDNDFIWKYITKTKNLFPELKEIQFDIFSNIDIDKVKETLEKIKEKLEIMIEYKFTENGLYKIFNEIIESIIEKFTKNNTKIDTKELMSHLMKNMKNMKNPQEFLKIFNKYGINKEYIESFSEKFNNDIVKYELNIIINKIKTIVQDKNLLNETIITLSNGDTNLKNLLRSVMLSQKFEKEKEEQFPDLENISKYIKKNRKKKELKKYKVN